MENEIKVHANQSAGGDINVDGISLLDMLNVCNLAIAGLPALVDASTKVRRAGACRGCATACGGFWQRRKKPPKISLNCWLG